MATIVDRLIPGPGSELDTASRRLQQFSTAVDKQVIERIRSKGAGRALVYLLRGNDWLGHPAHPIVVTVPIGAWVVGAWFDLRSLPGGRPVDEHAADVSLRLGVLGHVAAAATGLAQFLDTSGGARRQAAVHAVLNNLAFFLNVGSLAARAWGRRRLGRRLSAAALVVVGVSGHLGGDLAYRHRVGVQPLPSRSANGG
jgi:uncharacterized membrane protein